MLQPNIRLMHICLRVNVTTQNVSSGCYCVASAHFWLFRRNECSFVVSAMVCIISLLNSKPIKQLTTIYWIILFKSARGEFVEAIYGSSKPFTNLNRWSIRDFETNIIETEFADPRVERFGNVFDWQIRNWCGFGWPNSRICCLVESKTPVYKARILIRERVKPH